MEVGKIYVITAKRVLREVELPSYIIYGLIRVASHFVFHVVTILALSLILVYYFPFTYFIMLLTLRRDRCQRKP